MCVVLILAGCVHSGEPQPLAPTGETLEGRIDALAPIALEETPLAGFSVAVAHGDRVVLAKGYGFADLGAEVPVDGDTVYRIGSISKPFLAAAIVRLAEQDRLSLDDPVATFLPDLPIDPRITVQQLLSHTSGLANLGRMPGFEKSQGVGMTRNEVVEWIATQPLEYEPGTRWSYSNSGYLIGGLLLDRISGSGAQYMTDEIIATAALDDTTYCLSNEGPASTHGYELVGASGWDRVLRLGRPPAFIDAPPVNMPLIATVGPTCSTVTDLIGWLAALRDGAVVAPESYRRMTEREILPDGSTAPYGAGLQIREEAGRLTIGHSGLISGFVSAVRYFPEEDVTIALLANTAPQQPPERLWSELVDAVFAEEGADTRGGNR